ncbi:MAG: ATP-dependent zinc metalloprotease FtsH [Chloroflexota bacterium]
MNQPGNQSPRSGPGGPGGPGNRPRFSMSGRTWIIVLVLVVLFNAIYYSFQVQQNMTGSGARTTLTYTTFLSQLKAGDIKNATINGTEIQGDFKHLYKNSAGHTYGHYQATIATQLIGSVVPAMERKGVNVTLASQSVSGFAAIFGGLITILPLIFLVGIIFFISRAARQQQQGVFGFGKSKAKLYTEERPSTTFADVAGVDAAKSELQEIVGFLKDPTVYHRLGARIPKGVLLVGPPGTGKTLLARAVAGEAGVPFLAISATEFVEMFVGVGASRVRDLFERAKSLSPAIVFVDEIDAIGASRGGRGPFGGGGNDEREQTLNQLLVSMDGFEPNEAVIILAATNRPDVLDPALLRPGRFDREVEVDAPDRRGRESILKIHTRNIPLAPNVDLGAVARITPGMSGADLANLANEAALTAARTGETKVTPKDFDLALDRITLGSAGATLMNEDERRLVAYHESGHALAAFVLPNVDPVHRITITPRGRSLGVTQFLPADDRRNYRREFLLNRMAVGLGGRAAEELVFGEVTSGAQNDLQMITNIARTMVTQLGMADELGPTYFGGPQDDALNGRASNPYEPKVYSEATAHRIDIAIARLVEEAHQRASSALSQNREALDAIAAALIHDESLDREQFTAIASAHHGIPALPVAPESLPAPAS